MLQECDDSKHSVLKQVAQHTQGAETTWRAELSVVTIHDLESQPGGTHVQAAFGSRAEPRQLPNHGGLRLVGARP